MPIFHRNFVQTEQLASTYAEKEQGIPSPVDGYALFDTGASRTCADETVLKGLGLLPVEEIGLSTPSGSSKASIYACALRFPGSPLPDLDPSFVAGVQLQNQGYIALVGRDILRAMILIYDGPGARITFAF